MCRKNSRNGKARGNIYCNLEKNQNDIVSVSHDIYYRKLEIRVNQKLWQKRESFRNMRVIENM